MRNAKSPQLRTDMRKVVRRPRARSIVQRSVRAKSAQLSRARRRGSFGKRGRRPRPQHRLRRQRQPHRVSVATRVESKLKPRAANVVPAAVAGAEARNRTLSGARELRRKRNRLQLRNRAKRMQLHEASMTPLSARPQTTAKRGFSSASARNTAYPQTTCERCSQGPSVAIGRESAR